MAPSGETEAQDGVIATRPATAPEAAPIVVKVPCWIFSAASQPNTAVHPAIWVLRNTTEAWPPAVSAEPALKPNQPNHSSPAPIMTSGTLCGRIGSRRKPSRGPITRAQASAPAPESISTTVPPAKSMTCSFAAMKPLGENTQCATGKYTRETQASTYTVQPTNLVRSATAPEISAGVMIANISWKQATANSG